MRDVQAGYTPQPETIRRMCAQIRTGGDACELIRCEGRDPNQETTCLPPGVLEAV